jgi:SAM-dependent methyltransferase
MMQSCEVDPRLAREVAHFDQVYSEQAQAGDLLLSDPDKRRYLAPPADTMFAREYYYHLLAPLEGKRVLEIACGAGFDTCMVAHNGGDVCAYDVSSAAIDLTRKRAEANGVADRVRLQVCGDLLQAFPGEEFDAVIGYAALHHLPLASLGEQLRMRLRPGGVAVFAEPVVNSRWLNRVRQWIPYRPAPITDDEEPLNDGVIAELARPFDRLARREFECIARIYPLFSNRRRVVRALFKVDSWLMKVKPLRRFASVVVFAMYRDR